MQFRNSVKLILLRSRAFSLGLTILFACFKWVFKNDLGFADEFFWFLEHFLEKFEFTRLDKVYILNEVTFFEQVRTSNFCEWLELIDYDLKFRER